MISDLTASCALHLLFFQAAPHMRTLSRRISLSVLAPSLRARGSQLCATSPARCAFSRLFNCNRAIVDLHKTSRNARGAGECQACRGRPRRR
eukprot:4967589-Alexandrium_andersonii.AAC.1